MAVNVASGLPFSHNNSVSTRVMIAKLRTLYIVVSIPLLIWLVDVLVAKLVHAGAAVGRF